MKLRELEKATKVKVVVVMKQYEKVRVWLAQLQDDDGNLIRYRHPKGLPKNWNYPAESLGSTSELALSNLVRKLRGKILVIYKRGSSAHSLYPISKNLTV